MTKQAKSGEMNNITVEGDLNDLKPGEGVNGYEYGSNLETQSSPLIDPAYGKTVSIRVFDYKMNPDPKVLKNFPDKQTLFNAHAKQIKTILWADGLIPLENISPRVIIDTKKHKYQIFIPCQARSNVLFVDKPKSLTEVLSKTSKNGITGHS